MCGLIKYDLEVVPLMIETEENLDCKDNFILDKDSYKISFNFETEECSMTSYLVNIVATMKDH